MNIFKSTAAMMTLALLAAPASAVPVFGGSDLLTAGDAALLQQWRGSGPMTLTNIFDKEAGDNAYDFHAAVDNQGATFTLIEVLGNSHRSFEQAIIIGGYNPQSWDASVYGYRHDELGPRDAFIFNLNTDSVRYQADHYRGAYQTFNYASYGPTFGGGHDIWVNHNLNYGYTYGWSYTPWGYNGWYGNANILGEWGYGLQFGQIEVFLVDADEFGIPVQSVPEPGSMALWALGFTGLIALRRRRR